MTSPDRLIPSGAYGYDSSGRDTTTKMSKVTQKSVAATANADITGLLAQLGLSWVQNLFGGFRNVIQAIAAGINQFIRDLLTALSHLPVIGGFFEGLVGFFKDNEAKTTQTQITVNEQQTQLAANTNTISGHNGTLETHTGQIRDLQMIMQGMSQVFYVSQDYDVPADVTSLDVIILAGGGGGAAGQYGVGPAETARAHGGGGGGGGGEVHFTIPGNLVRGKRIFITVGRGGAPGTTSEADGSDGEPSGFGEIYAYGGKGGRGGHGSVGIHAAGGFGMIPGGDGGALGYGFNTDKDGGSSLSQYDLHGGGGGGGGGGIFEDQIGGWGGNGGVTKGGSPTNTGASPSTITATGGGGGGGGSNAKVPGDGGFPSGGGGGGWGNGFFYSNGGRGATGIVFVVEHFM